MLYLSKQQRKQAYLKKVKFNKSKYSDCRINYRPQQKLNEHKL